VYRLLEGIAGESLRLGIPEVGETGTFTFFGKNRAGMIE
jgi:hypothetical protein